MFLVRWRKNFAKRTKLAAAVSAVVVLLSDCSTTMWLMTGTHVAVRAIELPCIQGSSEHGVPYQVW